MNDVSGEKLNQLRHRAGARYTALIFYQKLCDVLAWVNLGLGILAGLICVIIGIVVAVNSYSDEEGFWLLVMFWSGGFGLAIGGAWAFCLCKIIANTIKAFVDIAVNSHLQVYLLSNTN